ncbi:hypothetical protein V9T40_011946 [Parthenolecanium corni]|uniref:NF-X1-type domain-containing protein n=1 Tax=Parthenolecanium corni TaxID=536013 RepID=A0AAN9T6X8_9HEMI
MSGESISSDFFSAVSEDLASSDESTNTEPHRPLANGKCDEHRVENLGPQFHHSLWRFQTECSREEKPLTNWRDRSQPRVTPSAFSTWRGGARSGDESKGTFQSNNAFVKRKSDARKDNHDPFGGLRRRKIGDSLSPASNGSALLALSENTRKVFGDSRKKFGSNSSITSNCSTSSVYQESRKTFDDSKKKKFGSGWSVASESSSAVSSCGKRSNAFRTGRRFEPTCQRVAVSPELSLKYLEILSQKEIHEIVLEVTVAESPFEKYLEKSPLESDWLILILGIVAKVCASDYEGNRRDLLYKLCKSPFFNTLSVYLGDMGTELNPETVEKLLTCMPDLCEFYSSLLDAWPMLVVEKNLKKLIEKTKVAVRNIPLYLDVPVDEDIINKLEIFTDIFDECKKMLEEKQQVEKRKRSKVERMANCSPPDNFRHLSLYPTPEDLFRTQRGFVRPNIIKGPYQSVEHYLDVHFRLLREDFIDSVRSGIQKYLASKTEPLRRFKFDNVRIYPDTRIVDWTRNKSGGLEVGVRLNFDPRRRFAWDCDWAHNKRFMHGSLLLLTTDDFNTFICATVLERDLLSLKCGNVLAALVEETPDFHQIFAKPFTMAESEVFFEPYFLILQTLKMLDTRSFPMQQYIVKGRSETTYPSYPPKDHHVNFYSYSFKHNVFVGSYGYYYDDDSDYYDEEICDSIFWSQGRLVSNDDTSFSFSDELDMYQMEAFKAGKERNLCVIQGPPGTGKTFLGLRLVESILSECRSNDYHLPILVVCLTNHALDQFLERILAFTDKIVRVGGQSRNERLTDLNLRTLRSILFRIHRRRDRDFESITSIIQKEMAILIANIENTQRMKKYVETPAGILSSTFLKQVVDPNFLSVVENDEILLQWLLEDNEYETLLENDFVDIGHLYENMINEEHEPAVVVRKREKTIFDLEFAYMNKGVRSHSITLNELEFAYMNKGVRSHSITLNELEEKLQNANEEYNFLLQTSEDSFFEQGYDSSLIHFEKTYCKNRVKLLTQQYYKLKANLEKFDEKPETKILAMSHQDPKNLPSKLRWRIYHSWLSDLKKQLSLEVSKLEMYHDVKKIQFKEYRMFEELHIMKQADIVGMTTTGAARQNKLLSLLKPAIVIVEEAAEVLEAHIVASLTQSCRHLILIGDHKQLRPSAAVHELCTHYHIDVSLFERMINNGMHCPMLKVQHRMRPEISGLISSLIYPDLEDHESVTHLDPVKGVVKNMFFLEHNFPETLTGDETSKENIHEAEYVVKLAKYFVQQGYNPDQITLLTFYAGQMCRIRTLINYNAVNVKCTVVDNYQGEENNIIILSLVRSNDDGNIGFLSIENRVCVALSRAKNGFFMIGNMDCLAKNKLWQRLRNVLKQNDAIGKEFPLRCDRHDKITLVSKASDFGLVSNGGCGAVCNLEMECGHICPKMCHAVLDTHVSDDCEEPCKRLCAFNHECEKLCKEDCSECDSLVVKLLPCEHFARVPCHISEDQYLCTELVEDVLLLCDHVIKRMCHQKPEDVKCTKPCRKRLNCGHTCTLLCHERVDPNHTQFQCKEQCGKYYEGCKKAHLCEKFCYEACDSCPFKEGVTLSCGHALTLPCSTDLSSVKCPHSCLKICPQCNLSSMKPCGESVHPCSNRVRKVIPTCGHEIDINCSDEPSQQLCKQKCQLTAPCGHKCQLMCGEECDSKGCKEWVASKATRPVCGHENVYVLCRETNTGALKTPQSFLPNCQEPCDTILECGHVCSGTCGQCLQGRLHQVCQKWCGRTFICGHRCKFSCQKLCPPCNEPCSFRCPHSNCNEKCGIPCSTCKKPCEWKCKHTKCNRKCGDICNRQPCTKPCELKLSCGHDCIGFCGEPCPQQCRFCNPEITNVIFGYENLPDARFVLMVDCNHTIESKALDQYFSATFKDGEIMLKGCPLCGMPITKTLRLMNFVKRMYQQIAEMKTKTFEDLRSFDLKKMLSQNWYQINYRGSKIPLFSDFVEFCSEYIPVRSQKRIIFSPELLSNFIYFFQACQVLISRVQEFGTKPMDNEFFRDHVLLYVDQFISQLQTNFNVNRQLMLDFNLELRRYHLMADYQCIDTYLLKRAVSKDEKMREICAEIEETLFGFTKFTDDEENKIKSLFEKLRTHQMISSRSSWPEKKLAMKELPKIFDDLKAGSWFQCLNGHYYCIDAMGNQKESTVDCPECVKKGILVTKESGRRRRKRGRR